MLFIIIFMLHFSNIGFTCITFGLVFEMNPQLLKWVLIYQLIWKNLFLLIPQIEGGKEKYLNIFHIVLYYCLCENYYLFKNKNFFIAVCVYVTMELKKPVQSCIECYGNNSYDVLQYFQFLELFCSKSIYTHICMCGCKKMDLRKKKNKSRIFLASNTQLYASFWSCWERYWDILNAFII